MQKEWSPFALQICLVCDFIWCVLIIGGCAYFVFIHDVSGWWFALAVFLATAWSCRKYRSPAQIAADPEEDE